MDKALSLSPTLAYHSNMLDRATSPKQTAATKRASIYPYYAGFSEEFVASILRELAVSQDDVVLDPWNGSGTTTAVCSQQGIRAIGVDINPAMRPIAAVRSMSADSVQSVCSQAISALAKMKASSANVSPFSFCHSVFEGVRTAQESALNDGLRFGFMVACRSIARRVRSKNPTWHSLKALRSLEMSADAILAETISSFTSLNAWAGDALDFKERVEPDLVTGDWDHLRWRRRVSHVITSPPYLTRIDYVMKTLPELLFLNQEKAVDFPKLRRRMLGSVLTKAITNVSRQPQNARAQDALKKIRSHDSKASGTYYYRFFCEYLARLETSFSKFRNTDYCPKTITIVSQGSYYKEIFVDLPAIIDEILNANGYRRLSSSSFTGTAQMITVNRRSAASILPGVPEVATIYGRV